MGDEVGGMNSLKTKANESEIGAREALGVDAVLEMWMVCRWCVDGVDREYDGYETTGAPYGRPFL